MKEGHTDEVIPFYENLVHRQRKDEFEKKLKDYSLKAVKVGEKSVIEIKSVRAVDDQKQEKESFSIKTHYVIKADFFAREPIKSPVLALEIVRADGVVCCVSTTKDDQHSTDTVEGETSVEIDLGRLNLAPGIYGIKFSVWDEAMIHPFAIRNVDVFFVKSDSDDRHTNAVFLSPMGWKISAINSKGIL